MYASWGRQPIPWSEFERFSVFTAGKLRLLEMHPHYPDLLRSRLPAFTRINSAINARFGKPAFYINSAQLEVEFDDLMEAVSTYVVRA